LLTTSQLVYGIFTEECQVSLVRGEETIKVIGILGRIVNTQVVLKLTNVFAGLALVAELEKRLLHSFFLFITFLLIGEAVLVLDLLKFKIPTDFTKLTHGYGIHVARELQFLIGHYDLLRVACICGILLCCSSGTLLLSTREVRDMPIKNGSLLLLETATVSLIFEECGCKLSDVDSILT
jgi:hypothetical protein